MTPSICRIHHPKLPRSTCCNVCSGPPLFSLNCSKTTIDRLNLCTLPLTFVIEAPCCKVFAILTVPFITSGTKLGTNLFSCPILSTSAQHVWGFERRRVKERHHTLPRTCSQSPISILLERNETLHHSGDPGSHGV